MFSCGACCGGRNMVEMKNGMTCIWCVFFLWILCAGIACGAAQEQGYFEQGKELYEQSRFDEAIRIFTKGIEADERSARLYLYRGNAYYSKAAFGSAIADYTAACSLDPGFALAYYNRAVAYYSVQDYDRAWDDVRRALSLGYVPAPEFFEQLKEDSGRAQ